jgi:hypothetical protein
MLLCALCGCGCDDKKKADASTSTGDGGDSGMVEKDAGRADSGVTPPKKKPTTTPKKDASVVAMDAGMEAGPNPFDYDAAGDWIRDANVDVGPAPVGWTCPTTLWNDGHCDCGCSVHDVDCKQTFSCTEPGCVYAQCEGCYTLSGSWKPCLPDPDPAAWTCGDAKKSDGQCDCGCGIPDPDCLGSGCSAPGCRTTACDTRNGCSATLTAQGDDCTKNPKTLTNSTWTCPWDRYGSGDGCDCGCGASDPDCNDTGCKDARCWDAACARCNDEVGRPYLCDAAQAGWDNDTLGGADTKDPSLCNATHFGSGDGCDCGCGGHDPDCGDGHGCDVPGCTDAACNRCTNALTLAPTGCATAKWQDDQHKCNPNNYGTGDGCDCGCGDPDPDCKGNGCTTPGCLDAACDVCNDGAGFFVKCPGWTCTDDAAWGTADCDCGCGVVDPYCRDSGRVSCTEAGCKTAACQHCNDAGHVRAECTLGSGTANGTEWQSGNGGTSSQCALQYYGLDGLCDCGCGAIDPDCPTDPKESCTAKGCVAPSCDVCHNAALQDVCYAFTCDAAKFGSGDGCDCGCTAPDPDCAGAGCREPGCKDAACMTCHDPLGRAVPCP